MTAPPQGLGLLTEQTRAKPAVNMAPSFASKSNGMMHASPGEGNTTDPRRPQTTRGSSNGGARGRCRRRDSIVGCHNTSDLSHASASVKSSPPAARSFNSRRFFRRIHIREDGGDGNGSSGEGRLGGGGSGTYRGRRSVRIRRRRRGGCNVGRVASTESSPSQCNGGDCTT